MYAAERVFAAAPPLYVVGLLIQLWWIPLRLLQLTGWSGMTEHGRDLSTTMLFVGMVLLTGASWELVRRSRGRVRVGMVLTFAGNVLGLALQLFRVYARMSNRNLYVEMLDELGWISSISYLLGVIGLAIAAGRAARVTSLIAIVLTLIVVVGPVERLIFEAGGEELLFWFYTALGPLRAVLLLIVVVAIAKQCYEPVRDPRRASRRFGLLVWLFAARATFACVMVGMGSASVITQLWLLGVESVLLALIVAVMWGIAQTQLPQLPRFSMHLGMVGVLMSVFLIAGTLETVSVYGMDDWAEYRRYVAIDTWQLAAAAIGGAVWVVALLRSAPAIRRRVVTGGIVFSTAVGYELIGDRHAWICEAIACVALLPMFHAMARALADDPVKTTADVFA